MQDRRPDLSSTIFSDTSEDFAESVSHIPYNSLSDEVGGTLGVLDILGLMYLYGPSKDVNLGDTLYDLSNTTEYTVVSDSGGIDTISFESTDRDIFLLLPDIEYTKEYTSLVDVALGAGFINEDTPQEITIGIVGNIENILTGSGDDYIVTNSANNTVEAGSGNDNIILSEGFDVVFGGEGADTFIANFVGGDLYYFAENTVIKDFEIGIDTLSVTDGAGELEYSRNEDGHALFTNDAGVRVVLEGIEANILLIA
jgi:serralysin